MPKPQNSSKEEGTQQRPALSINSTMSVRPAAQKQISSRSLENIKSHKALIAEMRPRRRKVQFHCENEDARTQTITSRVENLTLKDLSLHFGVTSSVSEEQLSIADSVSHHEIDEHDDEQEKIRKLESQVQKCTDMLERLEELILQDQALANQLQAENKELRRELVSCLQISVGRQSQKQLTTMIDVLERELNVLEKELSHGTAAK
jgi:hypothetical protein